MKVKDVVKIYKNKYTQIEIYDVSQNQKSGWHTHWHTDHIGRFLSDQYDNKYKNYSVYDYDLLDIEQYDNSVCANCCVSSREIYNEDDKILVIELKEEE